MNLAFTRWIEGQAINLRVVVLDGYPMPLYLQTFVQVRSTSIDEIVRALEGTPARRPSRRECINRSQEIGLIEEALYSPDVSVVWIWGLSGIGKRTLANEAARRITASRHQVNRVSVTAGVREVELSLIVAALKDVSDIGEGILPAEALESALDVIDAHVSSRGIWIFEDAQHWIEDDGTLGDIAAAIHRRADSVRGNARQRLIIFTSSRRPTLPSELDGGASIMRVGGLDDNYSIALMQAAGASATDDDLLMMSKRLAGHPLALEMAARQMPMTEEQLEEQRVTVVSEMLGQVDLGEDTLRVLEVLAAVAGPLPAATIAEHLALDSVVFNRAIAQAASYGLAEESDAGYLTLHPLVSDFYLRAFRSLDDSRDRISDLADRSRLFLTQTTPGTELRAEVLMSTFRLLGLSFRIGEALDLRSDLLGVLYATANQLYQEKEYTPALEYLNELLRTAPDDVDALLLKARCLAYLGDVDAARRISEEVVLAHPVNARAWRVRGRIEYIDRQWRAAEEFYGRALAFRSRYPAIYVDIAQARIRRDDWEGAARAINEARRLGDNTAWALVLQSQVLEHNREYEEAARVMRRAIRQDPRNPNYIHRLGRISELQGNRSEAMRHYSRAVAIDPRNADSQLSLASISAELGNYSMAEQAVRRARNLPNVRRAVLHNVSAKIHLMKGERGLAERDIARALDDDADRQNLGLAVKIALARIDAGDIDYGVGYPRVENLASRLDAIGAGDEAREARGAIRERGSG